MTDDGTHFRTRRNVLQSTAALGSALALAGCASDGDASGSSPTGDGTGSDETGTSDGGSSDSNDSGSYSVTMAPMGEVQFEAPPESWMAYFSTYGDMGIALGQLDSLESLIFTENWPMELLGTIPDLDVSFDGVSQLFSDGGIDKEAFYAADADVHLMDPNFIARLDDSWEEDDFAEVSEKVGPIVGNSIRRRGEEWHDYEYYSLYEAFEKTAAVFQQQDRFSALETLHDSFIDDLQSELPAEGERPSIGLLSVNSDFEKGAFYAYPVHEGNGHKQYRDLEINSAFGDHIDGSYAEWDYEQLLEVDPDVLVFQYGFSHTTQKEFDAKMETLKNDDVGSQLSAVENDRLYRGGTSYQGPLINLLQTEAAAMQFYPEQFGEWDGVETLTDESAQLFDHDKLGQIIQDGK